ncbi:unnamed protein product [Schistosoma curassoni]|uniref:Nanog homeobox n=1 Tax=Schistosoma curassoni TaxID=6186 RepID=A0A183L5Q0_9TREM|nr:unnamed protein product [Schistosoma curassoni]
MQTHAWLQASPALKVSSSYGVDLAGLSPDPLPGSTDEDENSGKYFNSDYLSYTYVSMYNNFYYYLTYEAANYC